MSGQVNPDGLLDGMREKLHSQWVQHRKQSFNNNTKGASYENALKNFLLEYFGGVYKIETRTAVIDAEMKCFDLFTSGESELDVVATFQQAVPGIIFQSGSMKWVPFDSVAFICEVKSEITKPSFEDDIEKLEKVNDLNIAVNRFGQNTARTQLLDMNSGDIVKRDLSVEHPLKCLVYDKKSISAEFLMEYATKNIEKWDLILIVEEDLILVSPELPFVDGWYSRTSVTGDQDIKISELMPDVLVLPDGLIWFILLISMSIPRPIPFTTTPALMGLVQREWNDSSDKYDHVINSFLELFD